MERLPQKARDGLAKLDLALKSAHFEDVAEWCFSTGKLAGAKGEIELLTDVGEWAGDGCQFLYSLYCKDPNTNL
ncbi:MAG: hypothetical protein RQ754_16275 [Desulfuromonadales bacterium]|nr:hypothetical protein [Desulfuromonadales bacterium]